MMTKPWKLHRQEIVQLYIKEGRTLQDVRQIMKESHGFIASIRAYRQHFDKWGVGKYNCKKRQSRRDIAWVNNSSRTTELALLAATRTPSSPIPKIESPGSHTDIDEHQHQHQHHNTFVSFGPAHHPEHVMPRRLSQYSIRSASSISSASSLSSLSSLSSFSSINTDSILHSSSSSDRDLEQDSMTDTCSTIGSAHGSPHASYIKQAEYTYASPQSPPQHHEQVRHHGHQGEYATDHYWTKFVPDAANETLPGGLFCSHSIPKYRNPSYTYFSAPRTCDTECFDLIEGDWSPTKKTMKDPAVLGYSHPGNYAVTQSNDGYA